MWNRLAAFVAALTIGSMGSFLAQQPQKSPPVRIYGAVESFSAGTLTIETESREHAVISLPGKTPILFSRIGRLEDIKSGDFVGSAAVPSPDGKLHAQEVHIFPESMRGAGEGHRQMDQNSARTMTNGTVSLPGRTPQRNMTNGTVKASDRADHIRTLQIAYKDGVQEIEVGPDVPIRYFSVGDASLLKTGAIVSVNATAVNDRLVATGIQVEKDGVKPLHP